jgi:hypothetical protein
MLIGDELGISSVVRADMPMWDGHLRHAIYIWLLYLARFLAALRFSTDTIRYLQLVSKCCRRSHMCKLIKFRLNDCLSNQYGYSGPRILQMMQDEHLITLNFRM